MSSGNFPLLTALPSESFMTWSDGTYKYGSYDTLTATADVRVFILFYQNQYYFSLFSTAPFSFRSVQYSSDVTPPNNWVLPAGAYVASYNNYTASTYTSTSGTTYYVSPRPTFGLFMSNDLSRGNPLFTTGTYIAGTGGSSISDYIVEALDAYENWTPPPSDPYAGGGTSGPGGGDGSWDYTTEDIDFSTAPEVQAYNVGFSNSYILSRQQVYQVAAWLWDVFDPANWSKLFNDPKDAIISLHTCPVTPHTSGGIMFFGNAELKEPDGSSMIRPRAQEQFPTVTIGPITVERPTGSFLDFSPYTEVKIYLPFIGSRSLRPEDVMGRQLTLRYMYDILTGACVCQIKVTGVEEGDDLNSVLYTFDGNASGEIAITGVDSSQIFGGFMNLLGGAVSTGAAAMTGGNPSAGIMGMTSGIVDMFREPVERSGQISANLGFMGPLIPYLTITTPHICAPDSQDKFIGYPSYVTATLGDVTGYTEIEDVHLEGIPCTLSELQAIETALKEGVIL